MPDQPDRLVGRFTAILPAAPGPAPERPVEEAPRKKREPQTRFTCLLPLPKEGDVIPVFGKGTGRRRKAAEPLAPADLPDPGRPAEPPRAAAARG